MSTPLLRSQSRAAYPLPRPAFVVAPPLPPALGARALGVAWLIALAVHALVLGLAALAQRPAAPSTGGPVRLVYLEPPPPPPAPLGAPGGTLGAAPAVAGAAPAEAPGRALEEPPAASAEQRLLRHAEPAAARPATRSQKVARPEAATRPVAPAGAASESADVEPSRGLAAGAARGEPAGAVGGVVGGVPGGIVGSAGTGPVTLAQVAEPPVLVRRVAPRYPETARRRDVEGLVLLEAVLDHEGRVEPHVKVLESIPMLDDEAIAAVRQWRFRPARDREGQPVRVVLEVPIRFVLR